MNSPTIPIPQRIYNKVITDLNLPKEIAAQFDITLESITETYDLCLHWGLNEQQAENTILKMWKNSITKR